MREDNWMIEEIDILGETINKQLDYLDSNPDDVDPDTIGTEIENSKEMFKILDTLRLLVHDIQGIDDMGKEVYTLNLFNDLMYGYPISPLHSYEESLMNGKIRVQMIKNLRETIDIEGSCDAL